MTDLAVLKGVRVGFALTGSHCTLSKAIKAMQELYLLGAEITPIISPSVKDYDTKFGLAGDWRDEIIEASGNSVIIDNIIDAEPIGPQQLLDIVIIAPCSGNSLAKLAGGIIDTAVLMAAKSHMRNRKPVVLAISTNDGLGANGKNIGHLLNCKNIFFVPFGQDNPHIKANSLIADMQQVPQTVAKALQGEQIQPLLVDFYK